MAFTGTGAADYCDSETTTRLDRFVWLHGLFVMPYMWPGLVVRLPVRQRVTVQTRVWCTSHYPVMHRCTWQTILTCCLKVTVASFVPQSPEHASFQEHTTATVTEVLLRQTVEQRAISLATYWHWLQRLRMPTENVSVWIDCSAAHCDFSFLCAL